MMLQEMVASWHMRRNWGGGCSTIGSILCNVTSREQHHYTKICMYLDFSVEIRRIPYLKHVGTPNYLNQQYE